MKVMRPTLPQPNPIIVKELRQRMRGFRPYAILTVFLVALVVAGYGLYQLILRQASFGGTILSFQVGQAVFSGLALCEVLLVVFLAPAMTSGAISSEREQLTYEMLLTTPLRPISILWGKLVSALSYIFLLIFAAIPVFSVVLLFGGVAPQEMVKALLLLIVTAIAYGTIGLFCSSLLRRTSRATVISYAIILALIGSTSLAAIVWSHFNMPMSQPVPPQLLYMNPLSALMSIITVLPDNTGSMFFGGGMFGLPVLGQLTTGIVYYDPNGQMGVLPIYRATFIFYSMMTVVLYWLSSHLVLARHRWSPRWSDLGFALILVGVVVLTWLTRSWWFVLPPTAP